MGSLQFVHNWLLDKIIKSELCTNWDGAYQTVLVPFVPRNENINGFLIVFKKKKDGEGKLNLNARLVLHGNRGRVCFSVCRDSATADLSVIRLIISLATILGFQIVTADVKGAYMQSGPIQREIYVRPPTCIDKPRNTIRKLQRIPYGIAKAGFQ